MTTPEEKQAYIESIKPYCLIVGFLNNGRFDCCVCLSPNDFDKEKRKFERWKTHYFIQEKQVAKPKVS